MGKNYGTFMKLNLFLEKEHESTVFINFSIIKRAGGYD